MARIPLGNNRFVEVPDNPPTANRFVVSYDHKTQGEQMIGIAFVSDDGVNARHAASVALPSSRLSAFAKSVVSVAETLGLDWQSVDERPLINGDKAH